MPCMRENRPPLPRRPPILPILAAALLATGLLPVAAAAQPSDAVVGIWLTEPGEQGGRAKVEVQEQDGVFVGRIVWLEEPSFPSGEHAGEPKIDLENPDPAQRDREILGLTILRGFTYAGDGTWSGGTIYDPANGKTYKAKMTLSGAGDDTLDVRGYVGISLFGRTSTWKRVEG